MLFNSLEFAIFLPLVLLAYYALGLRGQNRLLLAASLFFYGWWDWRFLGLVALSAGIDYVAGLRIDGNDDEKSRWRWLWASMGANLGILGFFKYFNFFTGSAVEALRALGFSAGAPTLEIILPVGISFYTFQSMSYTIDVWRRHIRAIRRAEDFFLFVMYFPQLVAGPIERVENLHPQLVRPRSIAGRAIRSGLWMIALGLFKKCVLADNVAVVADKAFDHAGVLPAGYLLSGVYAFAIQIYCDFSGYSDIARGSSRLLGIELMENFNQPHYSRNITEFWRRWHISLSIWLRDYLYIPLGGNRHGRLRTDRNLMATMLLGGLWHGANWTFVAWGGLHGLYLIVHKLFTADRPRVPGDSGFDSPRAALRSIASIALTFHAVCLTWVFFRADGIGAALAYIARLASGTDGWAVHGGVLAAMAVCAGLDFLPWRRRDHDAIFRLGPAWAFASFWTMILALYFLGRFERDAFIYFAF